MAYFPRLHVDPKMVPLLFNKMELWGPYEWPKIHVFHWGYCYFNPISGGKFHPTEITGDFRLAHQANRKDWDISARGRVPKHFAASKQLPERWKNPGMTWTIKCWFDNGDPYNGLLYNPGI